MWIIKRIITYVQKIIPRIAQNEDNFWTGVDQAYEVFGSVASNMTGFGSIEGRR